jgi:hypothetical protein
MKAKYNDIELEGTPEEVAATLMTLAPPVMVLHLDGIGSAKTLREIADEQLQRVISALGYQPK